MSDRCDELTIPLNPGLKPELAPPEYNALFLKVFFVKFSLGELEKKIDVKFVMAVSC